ncbi:MAG: hypothetical protein AAFX85_14470, partial [Pseudomonadota bacterium]
ARRPEGQLAITQVTLRPVIRFAVDATEAPDRAALRSLHDRAHRECFLANSVTCPIEVDLEAQWESVDTVASDPAGG